MLIDELLIRRKEDDTDAIICDDEKITFKGWYIYSSRMSSAINKLKLENSRNVALFLPNSIEYAVAYYAVLFADKVITPIGTQSKKMEIISMIKYCEIDLVITKKEYLSYLYECFLDYDYKSILMTVDDYSIFYVNEDKEFVHKTRCNSGKNRTLEENTVVMLHTSGTLSDPKRVMLTHDNLISNIESNIKSLRLCKDDRTLIMMPMHFGYCNTAQFLTHLYLGALIVIIKGLFMPKKVFCAIQKDRITNFACVPSILLMFLEYRYLRNYDISSLRMIYFGGSVMPIASLEKLVYTFKHVGFVQTYGQTEASPRITALLPENVLRKIGSIGKPIPNVNVRVVDVEGNDLEKEQIGEIIVKGRNVMKGYFKQEELTNEIIKDGWLHTGDIGYYDEDGYLYLAGRKKNIIISGGINIYPEEIEEVLLSHVNVKEACVVSEKHKILGEVPVAKIVLKENYLAENLKEYCSARLADYKVPVRFEIIECIDKTYNGKIKRYSI